jgi:taspase (threonine aspartase 1)
MQEHAQDRPPSQLQVKLNSARNKIRRIRQDLSSPFRKPQKYHPGIIDSSFVDQSDQCSGLLLPELPRISVSSDSTMTDSGPIMDGTMDRFSWIPKQNPANVSAIFVHAGAGYHSTTNEHVHLGACNEYVPHLSMFARRITWLLVLPEWLCEF